MLTLTLGMATYDDFQGVWETVTCAREFHPEVWPLTEVVVVDNNPDGQHGEMVREFIEKWTVKSGCRGARYIPNAERTGTAFPRDRVFREATGDVVCCVDSHVMVGPGGLAGLLAHIGANPGTRDLLQGPILYDDGSICATHMDPIWRGEMFGTWAVDPRGRDRQGEPFPIPMMGLGLFACRREAWLGFNHDFSGFGGEEGYIHAKVTRAGGRTLCLPNLRWSHRYGRPSVPCSLCGTTNVRAPYPLWKEQKVRNYLLASQELGLPVDDVRIHFGETLKPGRWEPLLREVYGDANPPAARPEDVAIAEASPDEFPAAWRLAVPQALEA